MGSIGENRWFELDYICMDCEWSASGEDDDRRPPAKRAIEHHVDRGHHVERVGDTATIPVGGSRFRL